MRYSFSQVKMIHECPYKYQQSYIKGIRIKGGIHALFGQAIHALLKDVLEKNYDRQTAIKYWASYFEREVIKDGIRYHKFYDYLLKRGYPLISMFYKNRAELDIQKIISLEVKETMIFDCDEFRYVCDVIYENSNGEVVLLDYKTGKQKEIDNYQLEFYSWQDKYKIDKICLYYFGEIKFFKVGEFRAKTEKYVRVAINTLKKGDFFKIVTQRCDKCDLYKMGHCDAQPGR